MTVSNLLDYKISTIDFKDYIAYNFYLDSTYRLRLYKNVHKLEISVYGLYNSMLDGEEYTLLKKRFLEKNI